MRIAGSFGLIAACALTMARCGSASTTTRAAETTPAVTQPTAKVCQVIVKAFSNTSSPLYKEAAPVLVHGCVMIAHQHGLGADVTRAQARSLALDYLARAGAQTTASTHRTSTAQTAPYSGVAPNVDIGPATDQSACPGTQVTVGPDTSCPFATNVARVVSVANHATGHFPANVTASSPVTGKTYHLRCSIVSYGSELACAALPPATGHVVIHITAPATATATPKSSSRECPSGETRDGAGNCVSNPANCPPGTVQNAAGQCINVPPPATTAQNLPCPPGTYTQFTTRCETDGSGAPICASGMMEDPGNGTTICLAPQTPTGDGLTPQENQQAANADRQLKAFQACLRRSSSVAAEDVCAELMSPGP
jgi:hypothetical protein